MSGIEFHCLPILSGALPYTDAAIACQKVMHYLKDIPAWPQLPRRSFLEDSYIQYSEGFPGVVVKDGEIRVDRDRELNSSLQYLYSASRQNKHAYFPIGKQYAAGLHQFLTYKDLPVKAVKGHVIGPVSWSIRIKDKDGNPVAQDQAFLLASAMFMKLKASWMEEELRKISLNTIVFVDEPLLEQIDIDLIKLNPDVVIDLIKEVFSGIRGLKGINCGGKPDWSLVLRMGPHILGFDAYNYAQSLQPYLTELIKFIHDGGVISWGIIPNKEIDLNRESIGSLQDRLEESMAILTRQDFKLPFRQLTSQSLISSSGGLAALSSDAAERALELQVDLSVSMRSRWG